MATGDLHLLLILVRGFATSIFFIFFVASGSRRHLVPVAGWLLYTISAVFRLPTFLGSFSTWTLVGLTSVGGNALIVLGVVGHLRSRVLRWAPGVLAATVLSIAVFVTFGVVPPDRTMFIAQAAILFSPIVVVARNRHRARQIFPGALYTLTVFFAVSVIFVGAVAYLDLPPLASIAGVAILNAVLAGCLVYMEHRLVLLAAQRTELRLRRAEEAVGIGIWERDGFKGQSEWSPGHYRIFGLPESDGPGPSWEEYLGYVHPDDLTAVKDAYKIESETGSGTTISYRIVRPDGMERWISSHAVIYRKGRTVGIVVDITTLKDAQARLEENLIEKEYLLAEVHHRVKNNLQVISSMLRLQFGDTHNNELLSAVTKLENRIQAMSVVQESLLNMPNFSQIDMTDYLQRLVDYSRDSIRPRDYGINLRVDADGVCLSSPTAILVGFIVIELVANSLRHGFPVIAKGGIVVTLSEEKAEYSLSVSDSGSGIPTHHESDHGLGIILVETFVAQLGGSVVIDGNKGTTVTVRFRAPESSQRHRTAV